MQNLLIAIPTYNEVDHVNDVIDQVRPFHPHILMVDDGSSDGTADVLATRAAAGDVRLLRHEPNQGYGQSLISAFDYAHRHGFDWVLTMDADGQHEADSIPDFVRAIQTDEWDLISGSRYLAATSSDDLPPPERRNVNHRITTILNNAFGMELTDSFCGFKAHRVSSMREMALTEKGYAFPLQLWPRVWGHNLRMKEIAVRRIYIDPNRSFGADLDNAERRFRHYMDVLNVEMERLGRPPIEPDAPQRAPLSSPTKLGCGCRG